jgi:hypothetical protein
VDTDGGVGVSVRDLRIGIGRLATAARLEDLSQRGLAERGFLEGQIRESGDVVEDILVETTPISLVEIVFPVFVNILDVEAVIDDRIAPSILCDGRSDNLAGMHLIYNDVDHDLSVLLDR